MWNVIHCMYMPKYSISCKQEHIVYSVHKYKKYTHGVVGKAHKFDGHAYSNVHFQNHLHCSFLTDYMLNYNFYGIYMYDLIIYGVEHRHKISQRI